MVLSNIVPQCSLGVPANQTPRRILKMLSGQRGLSAAGVHHHARPNTILVGSGPIDRKVGYFGGQLRTHFDPEAGYPNRIYMDLFIDIAAGSMVTSVLLDLPESIDDRWSKKLLEMLAPFASARKYLILPREQDGNVPKDFPGGWSATFVSYFTLRGSVDQTPDRPNTTGSATSMRPSVEVCPLAAAADPSSVAPLKIYDLSDFTIDRLMPVGLDRFFAPPDHVYDRRSKQTHPIAMSLMRGLGIVFEQPFTFDEQTRSIRKRQARLGRRWPGRSHTQESNRIKAIGRIAGTVKRSSARALPSRSSAMSTTILESLFCTSRAERAI